MRKAFSKQQTIEALLSDPTAALLISPTSAFSMASACIRINIRNDRTDLPAYHNYFTVRIDTARKIRDAVEAGQYPTLKVARDYRDFIISQFV